MAGLHETKYMRIFPIQEIDQNSEDATSGVAFAVQPHREVRPESGLVGIAERIVVNKR